MTLPPLAVCRRILKLHALIGSSAAHEADTARLKLLALLAEYRLSWNDLPAIVAATHDDTTSHARPTPQAETEVPEVNVLDLVLRLIELHIAITADERMAAALWILHTHVFDRFTFTPRLALLSPVRGCGKTSLLVLLELLTEDPFRTDNVTPAAIYHYLDHKPYSALLIDEADNLDLSRNGIMRAVFNAGHRHGGSIARFVDGQARKFPVFAPLALAAIGTLPLPLLHRSITINMQRQSGEKRTKRLDERDPRFVSSREQIKKWATSCTLARAPAIPSELRDRAADNWEVLLAIADDLGHGHAARSAAIQLSSRRLYEDPGVTLLADIRAVFDESGVDRLASATLVERLLAIDDSLWAEWRGPNDERAPRKLTQGELARLLRPFHIRPRTIWPARRRPDDRSSRGYWRHQFESAWRAYCPLGDTPTHQSKINSAHEAA